MNGKNYHEVKRVFVTCRAIIEECCGPRNGFILDNRNQHIKNAIFSTI